MFDINMGEMVLIAAIALVVFGPDKFPDFAKIVLRTVRDLRGYVDDIQKEVSKELKPLKKELDKISRDSEKYMDTLAKEADITTTTTAKSVPEPVKSQADPTDRQNDSFEYTPNTGYEHHAADPYASKEKDSESEKTAGQEEVAEKSQEQRESISSATGSEAENARDDLDFSAPPVERLD
jgi:Tat protein translocase TatB subunit